MMPCEPSVIVNKVRWLLAITINQRGGGKCHTYYRITAF